MKHNTELTLYDKFMLRLVDFVRIISRLIWKVFHYKLYKNYRKIIPNGIYCYKHISGVNKYGFPNVKYCPFHKHLWIELCMFDGSDCLMDSCKTCGINIRDLDIQKEK